LVCQEEFEGPQGAPLRYAPVGMTRGERRLYYCMETAGPATGLRGRPAESHICQKRADMGHPAVVAWIERKKRCRQVASIEMTATARGAALSNSSPENTGFQKLGRKHPCGSVAAPGDGRGDKAQKRQPGGLQLGLTAATAYLLRQINTLDPKENRVQEQRSASWANSAGRQATTGWRLRQRDIPS
jgi:hypothetical protein